MGARKGSERTGQIPQGGGGPYQSSMGRRRRGGSLAFRPENSTAAVQAQGAAAAQPYVQQSQDNSVLPGQGMVGIVDPRNHAQAGAFNQDMAQDTISRRSRRMEDQRNQYTPELTQMEDERHAYTLSRLKETSEAINARGARLRANRVPMQVEAANAAATAQEQGADVGQNETVSSDTLARRRAEMAIQKAAVQQRDAADSQGAREAEQETRRAYFEQRRNRQNQQIDANAQKAMARYDETKNRLEAQSAKITNFVESALQRINALKKAKTVKRLQSSPVQQAAEIAAASPGAVPAPSFGTVTNPSMM